MNFERYRIYELRQDAAPPGFLYALCLSSTEHNFRHEVKNISFLPIIPYQARHARDPFRVPVEPIPKGEAKIPSRMSVAVDAIQSIGKAAFLPARLGEVTVTEQKEIREKLSVWLDL